MEKLVFKLIENGSNRVEMKNNWNIPSKTRCKNTTTGQNNATIFSVSRKLNQFKEKRKFF